MSNILLKSSHARKKPPISAKDISAVISMNSQKLEQVISFKYPGATLCKNGTCSAEIWIRIASAMAAMARQNRIWWCNTVSFTNKVKFYKTLLTSSSSMTVKHEPYLLTLKKGSRLSKTKCLRKLLTWITRPMAGCGARSTSLWVHRNLFWQLSRDRNLRGWFGHITHHNSFSKIILQGTLVLEGG